MPLAPQVSARLAAPRLDARLAAGDDPFSSAALALRGVRLVSRRLRCRLAAGLELAWTRQQGCGELSAAIAVDQHAVQIARPALQQLAHAMRSRERVGVRGVALTHILLTHPESPLYRSRHPEELYEWAREALFAL